MEYNTSRDHLIISEYGRNVQKLVRYALTIEDREKRTSFAKVIIQIMGQMNPSARDSGDFRHKLWDHLHIISDFQLDVDTSYPVPSKESLAVKPDKLEYRDNNIDYKMYGTNIEKIIEAAIKYDEGDEKDALVHTITNHMKKSYLNWNRESVDDTLIFEHLKVLSDDKLKLKDGLTLNTTSEILARNKKKKEFKPSNKKQHSGYKKRKR
ncbi:MAG: DUF4290 domain-containing protein [Bacteroidales bacterium]|nr:DUF4290 domain-containing protein [Bacteroidales bacterium]